MSTHIPSTNVHDRNITDASQPIFDAAEKLTTAVRKTRTAEVNLAQCGGDMDRRAWQKAEEAEDAARDNFNTVVRMCVGDLLRGHFPVLSKQ